MQMKTLNREVLQWPKTHPARRFLEAFIACRRECVGREIVIEGSGRKPIDQAWVSATDGATWAFSKFAYTFLSFDLVLDGWLSRARTLTPSETAALRQIPLLRRLMHECKEAALKSGNTDVLALTDRVIEVLDLWEQCIRSRVATGELGCCP